MKALLQKLKRSVVGIKNPGDFLIATPRGDDFLTCENGDILIC